MRSIIVGVAALALIAGTAHAQGQGQGRGNDRAGGNPPAAAQAGGPAQGQGRGQGQVADRRGPANGPSMADSMRGAGNRAAPDQREGARGERNGNRAARATERAVERAVGNPGRGNAVRPGDAARAVIPDRGRDGLDIVRVRERGGLESLVPRGLIEGCPPGLAMKNPPCVPPGLARPANVRRSLFDSPDWWGLSRLGTGRYVYDEGYLVRLGTDGRIGSYIPLLGGALAPGNPWPSFYAPVALPDYYVDYYGLGPVDRYGFADNVIYRLDPETAAITSVVALLTGDNLAIGQSLPRGYDVYNVPWDYRERYYDRPDALYRYADGYIYEVDPATRLIAAAIELIAS